MLISFNFNIKLAIKLVSTLDLFGKFMDSKQQEKNIINLKEIMSTIIITMFIIIKRKIIISAMSTKAVLSAIIIITTITIIIIARKLFIITKLFDFHIIALFTLFLK